MYKRDLQRISDIRLSEAKVLLDNEYYSGAYYQLGYSVECALKACIAKQVQRHPAGLAGRLGDFRIVG